MKKLYLVTLLSIFVLGTVIAALQSVPLVPSVPSVKAHPYPTGVRFYIWNATSNNNMYTGRAVGTSSIIEVWVDSPDAWTNTASGIVSYGLSIRVDPTVLEVMSASKIPAASGYGFLEHFLNTETDPDTGLTWADLGYATTFAYSPTPLDAAAKSEGIIRDMYEGIQGYSSLGRGAGGGPWRLCRFVVRSRSATNPSPLIITGRQPGPSLEVTASYSTPDGVWHYVDAQDIGWYRSSAYGDKYFLDSTSAYPPIVGSTWNQLSPTHTLTVTDYVDTNLDGIFNATDVLTMRNETSGAIRKYEVNFRSGLGTMGDGVQDLIVTRMPEVPEFPLGLAPLMILAPAIPIVYLWRIRKRKVG